MQDVREDSRYIKIEEGSDLRSGKCVLVPHYVYLLCKQF